MFTCPKCSHSNPSREGRLYVCPQCDDSFTQYQLCFGTASAQPSGVPKESVTRMRATTYATPADRERIKELIIQAALRKENWQSQYAYQMQRHLISADELIAEIVRRGGDDDRMQPNRVPRKPHPPGDDTSRKLPLPFKPPPIDEP